MRSELLGSDKAVNQFLVNRRGLTQAELREIANGPEVVRDAACATERGSARPPGTFGYVAILFEWDAHVRTFEVRTYVGWLAHNVVFWRRKRADTRRQKEGTGERGTADAGW